MCIVLAVLTLLLLYALVWGWAVSVERRLIWEELVRAVGPAEARLRVARARGRRAAR